MRHPNIPFHDELNHDEGEFPGMPMALPDDGSPAITNSPASGVDLQTGLMASKRTANLAKKLNWSLAGSSNSHPLVHIQYHGRRVPVDVALAPTLTALWNAGYISITACQGDGDSADQAELGYVMFSEVVGKAFMEFALRNERWLSPGFVQRFEWTLQSNDWHNYMSRNYPLLEPVYPDPQGRVFTVCWRFEHADLVTNGRMLVELLRMEPKRRSAV